MAILATGNTFADGDQVTSTKLNNIADAATFAADAVDDSTTELGSGKIIIKDGGVTPAKLSTNHPNWDSTGLGVGTSSPTSKLDIESSSSSADGIDINNTSTGDPVIKFQLAGTSKFTMGVDNSDSDKFKIGIGGVETSTCLTIDSTGPKITIGNGAAADTAIIFDGNAQDFYIALDDSEDDLLIGLGSTVGTTAAITIDENLKSTFGGDVVIGGTTPTLTIGDAGAEDTAIVFDGNAQDFYIGLDDSADDLVIGVGSTVGTTSAISITDGRAVTLNTSLTLASGSTVTAVLDEDNMSSDSATSLATQQSIKAYVDTQITAEDLDIAGDTGTGAVDLDSQSLTIASNAGLDTVAGSQTLTISLDFNEISDAAIASGDYIPFVDATDSSTKKEAIADIATLFAGTGLSASSSVLSVDASQTQITAVGTLATGSISSGFSSIDIGSSNLTATGSASLGATSFNDNNITNVGSIALDTITNDGTDVTIDSSGDIILDADGADIRLKDAGTEFGAFTNSSTNFVIGNYTSDKDIIFKGNDGGSTITALTLDMSAAGAATFNSTIAATGFTIGSETVTDTQLAALSVTAGTISASKAVVVDSNKDIDGFRNVTVDGELDAATLDISGNADIAGTTNLDAVDIDGNVQLDGTLTVGVDDVGKNVKFFGATSGAYLSWDEAANKLLTAGAAVVDIVKDKLLIGGTAVTSTAAELNILDGVTSTAAELNILDGVTSTATELNFLDDSAVGSVVNSKAVIYGSSGEVAGTLSTAAQGNVTSLGTLTALTVDNLGVNGNTITANSGALNLIPASGSAILLDGTISVDAGVVTGATSITSTAFVGTLSTAAQANITSLGTLTALTVDNVAINGTTIGHTSDTDLMTVASGALTVAGTVTVGVDDTGHDVKFFGAKAGSYMLWDESVDDLVFEEANIEMTVSGDANGDKAIVINSIGTNFESDGGMIRGVHASTGTGVLTGGYWIKFSANGSDQFTVKGNGELMTEGNISSRGLLDCSNDSGTVRVRQQVSSDRGYLFLYSENDYAIGRWYADANGSLLTLYETEAQQVRVKMGIDDDDDGYVKVWSAANANTINISGDGTITKSSSTFNIPHPLESKRDTHRLVHSVIEGPQADLIYRGRVDLVDGSAEIDIDSVSGMTDGTFVVLCRDVQSFTTNESGWTAVRSSVSGNTLTIEAQDATCTDSISWMVVGERQDDHMMDTGWTDENGKAIVEPLNPEPEPEEEEIEPLIEEEEEEVDE